MRTSKQKYVAVTLPLEDWIGVRQFTPAGSFFSWLTEHLEGLDPIEQALVPVTLFVPTRYKFARDRAESTASQQDR